MPDDIPDDRKIDIIVAVNDTIPHARHPFPRDNWIFLSQMLGQPFRCFPDDLKRSYNREIDPKIGLEL